MKKSILIITIIIISILFISCGSKQNDNTAPHNLIKNPSFEIIHSGWASGWHKRSLYESEDDVEYSLVTGDTRSGERTIQIHSKSPNDCRVYQYVSVLPETVYKLSGWIKAENISGGGVGANLSILDSGAHTRELNDTKGEWVHVSMYGITAPYQTKLPVSCRIGMWGGGVVDTR